MAAYRKIHCEQCGSPRLTRRANTKYCRVCRTFKNIEFIGDRKAKCIGCNGSFSPLLRGDDVCGKCTLTHASGDPRGECKLCGTDDAHLIDENIAVCEVCAYSNQKRGEFKKALLKKIRHRMAGTEALPEVDVPESKTQELETGPAV